MPRTQIADVARRHGVTRWQVYDWRRRVRDRRLALPESVVSAPAFATPVVEEPAPPMHGKTTEIKIVVSDVVVLDPGRRRTKKGFFWVVASDDRGYGGAGPPIVLFRYAPGRSDAYAEQFLDGFRGRLLQCDGYEGYDRSPVCGGPRGGVPCRHQFWLKVMNELKIRGVGDILIAVLDG